MRSQTVDSRLVRVERRLRVVVLLASILCVITLFAAYSPAHPDVVRAERFELVDSGGQVRATLEITGEEEAGLFVMDDSSRVRLSLTHAAEQTALFIKDASGGTRVGAAQFSHGGGGFALHGENMKGAAVLYLQNHQGSLRVFNIDGEVTYQAP